MEYCSTKLKKQKEVFRFIMGIILASGSPRRQELLKFIVPEFKVICSNVSEDVVCEKDAVLLTEKLAKMKCLAVAEQFSQDIVIGCDTLVEKNQIIYGKPKDWQQAFDILKSLSDTYHYVHTGVCIAKAQQMACFSVTTKVCFYPITDREIEGYLQTNEPFDKAGGYGIQGYAARFVKGIDGCYYNVMGLPVSRVARALEQFL